MFWSGAGAGAGAGAAGGGGAGAGAGAAGGGGAVSMVLEGAAWVISEPESEFEMWDWCSGMR